MPSDTPAAYTDIQEQVRAIKANDEQTLQRFYQSNYQKTERYVLDNSGTIEEAKDVFQEAFIAVWRNIQLDRFQLQTGASLDGYLYQVAKNKWLDQLRRTKRMPVVSLAEGPNGLEAPLLMPEEEQQLNAIKANLKKLGETCQDVLNRFYYRRQSLRTIAEAMNWTEATAKNNKYRCLQRLRETLKTNTPNLG